MENGSDRGFNGKMIQSGQAIINHSIIISTGHGRIIKEMGIVNCTIQHSFQMMK